MSSLNQYLTSLLISLLIYAVLSYSCMHQDTFQSSNLSPGLIRHHVPCSVLCMNPWVSNLINRDTPPILSMINKEGDRNVPIPHDTIFAMIPVHLPLLSKTTEIYVYNLLHQKLGRINAGNKIHFFVTASIALHFEFLPKKKEGPWSSCAVHETPDRFLVK